MIILNRTVIRNSLITVLILVGLSSIFILNKKKVCNFKEGSQVLNNPERGFYVQIDSKDNHKFKKLKDENVRLALLAFDIEKYKNGTIGQEKLYELEEALKKSRESNISIIFRAAYGFHEASVEPKDISIVCEHIKEISKVLNKYADTINVVQAGFLGDYGEWHHSIFLQGTEEEMKESRLQILKAWEENLDNAIEVAVRRPRFIREAQAANILSGRLAFHNDALLSTDSDMGTYDDKNYTREEELKWCSKNLIQVSNGGEMPKLGELSTPENADKEFQNMHITYLNMKYNAEILKQWQTEEYKNLSAKDYVENHLGYRIYVKKFSIDGLITERKINKTGIPMEFEIVNTGYATLPSKYKIFLIIKTDSMMYMSKLENPEIYGISNDESVVLKNNIILPNEVSTGKKVSIGIKVSQSYQEEAEENCISFAGETGKFQGGVNLLFDLTLKNYGEIEVYK